VAPSERSLPVAVFDSGVGGLTVLHECLVSLPHEDLVYLGDTARFPYGDRSAEELLVFARELAETLLDRGAKLLVVACNSATAAALPALRARMMETTIGVDVLAVVRPEAAKAVAATRNGRIGLLATPATIASGSYRAALAEFAPDAELHAVACPELAPLIQAGAQVDERVVALVERYCAPLREAGVDTVILGCTHYPLLRPLLQRSLGRGVTITFSGEAIAGDVEAVLRAERTENDLDRRGSYRFLCSGDPDDFRRVGTRFLQLPFGDVRRVDVRTAAAPPRAA
jgi:glutamate racemase